MYALHTHKHTQKQLPVEETEHLNIPFLQGDTQRPSEYIIWCLMPFIPVEIQIDITVSSHSASIRLLETNSQRIGSVDEDAEKLEPSSSAGGIVK